MKTALFCSVLALFCLPVMAAEQSNPIQIAFLPDVHFHDVYAEFKDDSFKGLPGETSGKAATIRTMAAQLQSTRLFNENYFALHAALDDLVRRKVKLVVLPGDFSDDGQTVHIRGLKRILQIAQLLQHGEEARWEVEHATWVAQIVEFASADLQQLKQFLQAKA